MHQRPIASASSTRATGEYFLTNGAHIRVGDFRTDHGPEQRFGEFRGLVITNRAALQPVRVGVEIASALWKLFGDKYDPSNMWRLVGAEDIVTRLRQGEDPATTATRWSADEARWRRLRAKYLIYR